MIEIIIRITETQAPEVCTEYHINADDGTELEMGTAKFIKAELNNTFDRMRDVMAKGGAVEDVTGPSHIVTPTIENMKRRDTPPENPRFKIE
jgi:hypothetical protein